MKRILFAALVLITGFLISPWFGAGLLIVLFYKFPFFYEGFFAWYILELARNPIPSFGPKTLSAAIVLILILHFVEFVRPNLRMRL